MDEEEREETEETVSGESGDLGSWDHDLQEQYVRYLGNHTPPSASEGASFESPRDVTMKGVLAFGEDYGDFLRLGSSLRALPKFGNIWHFYNKS